MPLAVFFKTSNEYAIIKRDVAIATIIPKIGIRKRKAAIAIDTIIITGYG